MTNTLNDPALDFTSKFKEKVQVGLLKLSSAVPSYVDDLFEILDLPIVAPLALKFPKSSLGLSVVRHILETSRGVIRWPSYGVTLTCDSLIQDYIQQFKLVTRDKDAEIRSLGDLKFIMINKKRHVLFSSGAVPLFFKGIWNDNPFLTLLTTVGNTASSYTSYTVAKNSAEIIKSKTGDEAVAWLQPFVDNEVPRVLLIQGPPGTGKTVACSYIASQLSNKTLHINSSALQGLSAPDLNLMISRMSAECVILDDFDRLSNLSTYFDTIAAIRKKTKLVLITTNYVGRMPEALCRPGRIDKILFMASKFSSGLIGDFDSCSSDQKTRISSLSIAEQNELALRQKYEKPFNVEESLAEFEARKKLFEND